MPYKRKIAEAAGREAFLGGHPLYVRLRNGVFITVRVWASDTIANVKNKIADALSGYTAGRNVLDLRRTGSAEWQGRVRVQHRAQGYHRGGWAPSSLGYRHSG